MFRALRNFLRLLRLARSLARHDALFPLEALNVTPGLIAFARLISRRNAAGRPGQRLARALQEMGPSFIKLGQALSTRADILSEQVADDLAELQDHLPPFPADRARRIIEDELGRPVASLFASFEDQPVAAASIAQVHFALTPEGKEVAVKVLRPHIERDFAADLDLLYWLAELVEATQPQFRRLRPVASVRAFAEMVRIEMDLRMEAAGCEELGENFAGDPGYRTPEVDWERTAQRVLTIERVRGIPIDERAALIEAGHDPAEILRQSAEAFFYQVFRDGFFHGDMHGGNAFVDAKGTVIPVDFGIMGRVEPATRRYLAELLVAFLRGDYREVAAVQFRAGYVPPDKSLETFAQACRSVGRPIFGKPSHEISIARLMAQLFRVTEQFEMAVQPELLLLQKTMLMAEGMGVKLNPEVNIWQLAQPLIEDWMLSNFGPRAQIERAVKDVRGLVQRGPGFMEDIAVLAAAERRKAEAPQEPPRFGNWRAADGLILLALALAVLGLFF
ncbi:MAG: putative protein kinase UbiB [Alphaproteobacteria bacterium]|jgi:ubiquinone biosynthesis protein|nr:putative protein kinase UbiB [Alphaproteobacteria bacterium]